MSNAFAVIGMGATDPGTRLISLGIETVVQNQALVTQYYNYFAIFTIALLAFSAAQRDTRFFGLLLPLWAGFCMWAGWLVFPNQATGFAIIVICTMLAIMTYMQDTLHERFGIAGPGNRVVKIFTFLIILQCVVVFVNSAAIFGDGIPAIAASNPEYNTIDLASNMGAVNSAGGLTASVVDIATIALQTAYSVLLLLVKCIISIAAFSIILNMVFPWIGMSGAIGIAFLVVVQFAIWIMYLLFIFTLFYKPPPDPGY
jgi:hypothetical protein